MIPNELPPRRGARPRTTRVNPHTQLDQNAPPALQDRVRLHATSLPGVRSGPSLVSVPGALGFFLDRPPHPPTVPDLFRHEWGHLHPPTDGSLHLTVTEAGAKALIARGWGEYHLVVGWGVVPPVLVMVYGPRDEEELDVVLRLVDSAFTAAGGDLPSAANDPSDGPGTTGEPPGRRGLRQE